MDENDWPPVRLKSVRAEVCTRWSGLRDVAPIFSRRPYGDWCSIFRDLCEDVGDLERHGAGFVRCDPGDFRFVEERLAELTADTNSRFREFLSKALINQPADATDLIAMEGSLAASDEGAGYLCS